MTDYGRAVRFGYFLVPYVTDPLLETAREVELRGLDYVAVQDHPYQRRYVDTIRKNEMVFAIGPAGTGKTYLAVLMAVRALKRGEVQRIVLSRPAVEAGEKLGFLPGNLKPESHSIELPRQLIQETAGATPQSIHDTHPDWPSFFESPIPPINFMARSRTSAPWFRCWAESRVRQRRCAWEKEVRS